MTKIAQQQQEADNQAAAQMQQTQLEQQLQIHQEERGIFKSKRLML